MSTTWFSSIKIFYQLISVQSQIKIQFQEFSDNILYGFRLFMLTMENQEDEERFTKKWLEIRLEKKK